MKKLIYSIVLSILLINHVLAQSVSFPGPGAAPANTALTVVFTDNDAQNSAATTYTFTSKNIGAASSNRYVAVIPCVIGTGPTSVSSITIGGISATQIITANNTTNSICSLWTALVPTGTTANVVITWGSLAGRTSLGVWAIYGGTGLSTATSNSVGSNPSNLSLNIPTGGVAIGGAIATNTSTYVGLTKNFDTSTNFGGGDFYSGGNVAVPAGASPQTITVTRSSSSATFDVAIAASFGP